jgi:hypothetical protein
MGCLIDVAVGLTMAEFRLMLPQSEGRPLASKLFISI